MKIKNSGFTLLELLIAISILAVLTVFSNQSIQNAMRAKVKIHDKLQDMSAVRDALRVMERDINLAYHYRDIETEYKELVKKNSQTTQTPPPQQPLGTPLAPVQPNPIAAMITAWAQKDPDRKDPTTHFIGANEEIHFASMNSAKLSEETPQADFIKVGYYLTECRKPGGSGQSSKCLVRSSDPLIEGDITRNGPATVLLENVGEFKLRYIGKGKQDWVSDWNSKNGDGATKDNFPEAVEISITTSKMNEKLKVAKKISMQIVAPIRYPNNADKSQGPTLNDPNAPPPPPGFSGGQ
jgi:prepilin-type N-terminal cleavage/methylation domain-containing protein